MKGHIRSQINDYDLGVAAPWCLSHYIALNGFHPLYRALVDHAPDNVRVLSWDNVSLYETFVENGELCDEMIQSARRQQQENHKGNSDEIEKAYREYFWPPNQVLTERLPGDIELHHTAPFPSMTRPFVLHCESFAPIFFPLTQQGGGRFKQHEKLREYYRHIFTSSLCLGIFSHIPETLNSIRLFFDDPEIERKLFPSRMGLSAVAFADADREKPPLTDQARFLFVNSANQNPGNFFRRGGHIVLRFWEKFRRDGRRGLLMLRCARPSDSDLRAYGVNTDFLNVETGESVIWAQDYLTHREMNALMADAHFFLLPSNSLHSVSIMQAMKLGAIPVVSDTIGTEQYVQNEKTGIVLKGVRETLWKRDPTTGVFVDQYRKMPELDADLTEQMYTRIGFYLDHSEQYQTLRTLTRAHADTAFCGEEFSWDFWTRIRELHVQYRRTVARPLRNVDSALKHALLTAERWPRVFESATQPLLKFSTGSHSVWELGGSLMLTLARVRIDVNDWSVMAPYFDDEAPSMVFARDIERFGGRFLPKPNETAIHHPDPAMRFIRSNPAIRFITRVLTPYPRFYRFASAVLKQVLRLRVHLVRRGRYIAFKYWPWRLIKPDVELIWQDVAGHNVVRFFHRYYGYPQKMGLFEAEDEVRGRYRSYPCAWSMDTVVEILTKRNRKSFSSGTEDFIVPDIRLIQEGLYGFNVIQVNHRFYAILQSAGRVEMDKITARSYKPMFEGESLEEIRDLVGKYHFRNKR